MRREKSITPETDYKKLLVLFVFGNSFSLSLSFARSLSFFCSFFWSLFVSRLSVSRQCSSFSSLCPAACWLAGQAKAICMRDDCWSAQSQVSFIYGSYSKHRRIKCERFERYQRVFELSLLLLLLVFSYCYYPWNVFFFFSLNYFRLLFFSLVCNYLISSI